MRIDQLQIQNFRCFDSLTLDLHPEFNVLIGENGAGKTALLEALVIATGDWLRAIGGLARRDIDTADVRLVGRRVGDATTFEPQPPVSVTAHGRVGGLPAKWIRTLGTPNGRVERDVDAMLRGIAKEAARRVRAGEEVTLPLIAYYDIGRLWASPDDDEEYSPLTQPELSRLEGYRDTLTARTGARGLTRWLAYQDYVAYQEKQEAPIFRVVLEAMRGMVERAADVRFDAKRLEVVVEFEGGEVHPFAHLSDGQRNMLALAGDIAMRMARLNPQFDSDVLRGTPGVVLIDELDLHLHPRWQRHVVEDLRRTFPLVQFVTTTHSPQIVSEVQPECLMTLARRRDHISIERGTQAYGLDTNWILEHLMEVPARPKSVQTLISRVENELEEGELDGARRALAKVRDVLHGDDGDVARLEASINNLEALANAVD